MLRIVCPTHTIPDCSPLLNGCSLPTKIREVTLPSLLTQIGERTAIRSTPLVEQMVAEATLVGDDPALREPLADRAVDRIRDLINGLEK